MDKEFAEAFKEEIELDEMKWAVGGVYHQEYKNGDRTYFRADSVQKNKRWKGMSVDEFGGRQKKAKNASADEKAQGWETTPKNEIPKGLKEEVELDEFYTVFAVRHKEKDGKRYVIPFKTKQKADKKAKELKSSGATEIEVTKEILKGNIKWKEEVEIEEAGKAGYKGKSIGLECQECGKRFRSMNPRYGITKCPKCKSTDLDLAYGEEIEEGVTGPTRMQVQKYFDSTGVKLSRSSRPLLRTRINDTEFYFKIKDLKIDSKGQVVSFKEEVELDEKFAGWIAFYNREKYEIKPKKGEIDSLYDAKQAAIKHFRIPKSKQGLLAIKPAHEEVEEARSKEDELRVAKAIAAWKKAGGKVKKLPPGRKFQSLFGKGYKPKKQPRQAEEVVREARTYLDKKYEKKKKGLIPQSQKKKRWGSGGYGKGEEVEVDENKIVVGGKELDREWTGWWWDKKDKWTVVDGKNNMLWTAKSSGEVEKRAEELRGFAKAGNSSKFSLSVTNPGYVTNHGRWGMSELDGDKMWKSIKSKPDQITIRKIDKKDHDRWFKREKLINKEYDYNDLELSFSGGRKHYAPVEKEEVEEKRSATGYELYHKDFSSAMQHAYKHAKSKGHIVDPKEIDDKVATGPKKPSSGKTNRYALKAGRKTVHIQVANLDNKRYELNMYIESIQERYETQSKMFPKVLIDGLTKAIPGVKLYRHAIKHPRSGQRIPGLGLLLSGEKGIRIMVQYDRESEPAPKGMDKTIVDIDPETGKKEVTDTSFRDSYAVWVNDVGKIWKADELRWIQTKDFRDPKKVVQFLKTKVKRMKEEVEEVLDIKNTKMADVIKDFQDSDAPQFKGKSDKKRREMAIAAKLSADRNESVKEDETDDPKSKKKDKINLKPKMDEKMKKYKDLLKGLKERKSTNEDSDKDTPGTQGDDAEWQKKRSAVLKKFGVGSCAALKDDKEKKACYKALDDAHVADHEEQVQVKEAVTTGGIEYGEQDWDIGHRLENIAPYLDSNFAEFHEQGLEGPYLWHGETYFFDRKVGGWYSVTAEDYVDDEISKDLSLAYVKDGMYKRQFAS